MEHFGDITKISGFDIPSVDIITGGSPCQDLSVAGRREGLDGVRSGLFMEQIRIVKEMRMKSEDAARADDDIRPRYMVWENVLGAFSSNGGRDFQTVLTEIVKIKEPDCPDVPMPEKGKWPKSGCIYDEMGNWSIAWRVHDAQFWGVAQRRKRIALVADFGGLSAPEILFERQGVRGDPSSGREARKETAGDVRESTYPAVARSLLSRYDGSPCVDRGPDVVVYDARGNGDGETVCTLTGDHQDRVTDYTALCVGNGQLAAISMKPIANTLDTMHDQQAVMCFHNTDEANPVAAVDVRNCTENADVNGTLQAKEQGYIVRRLTPLECERLQGYPDGWTDIGSWTDSSGKARDCSDTARYKALGNSIALPFWQYLARRIVAQYEHDVTMGSLFDGIGGFPLVFERCGAKAVWASEIDEFPIAVTKKHFPEK